LVAAADRVTTYSVIGLGKLGASMAAALAMRGNDVIGVDINARTVELVNAGHAPVHETDLERVLATHGARIRASTSHQDAILGSDITFVIVPTPSDSRGAYSLQYATWAFAELGRALREKQDYHLVVLTSTVLPGSTRYGLLPVLERESGKQAGLHFGMCYSPEFIALGSIMHDFLHPDFVLVGEFDRHSGDMLEHAYRQILPESPPAARMSLENAELAKVALNTFVTTKITFANMLSGICERLPGGDVDAVTRALGLDRRIGPGYLTGALGYGGPCFPRDNIALSFLADALGARADLATTTDASNRGLVDSMVDRLSPLLRKGATAAVLGLAFKPASNVVEESQGLLLAKALDRAGMRVVAYDPLANETARAELRDHAVVLESVRACLEQADLVLITTPDPVFKALRPADFVMAKRPVTIVDFWRILPSSILETDGIRLVPIGRSMDDEKNAARLASLWSEFAQEST
jgi:UDPglucose 6-dehydrogenase